MPKRKRSVIIEVTITRLRGYGKQTLRYKPPDKEARRILRAMLSDLARYARAKT